MKSPAYNAETAKISQQPRRKIGWLEIATVARRFANELMQLDRFRGCMSRAYYAAYLNAS
jgi:hypothetical protein